MCLEVGDGSDGGAARRGDFVAQDRRVLAGLDSEPIAMAQWPLARCSGEFCVLPIQRGGRTWQVLMARNRELVEERALAAACERADIVVADRYLPRSCNPRWLKADRKLLEQTGGLSVFLDRERLQTVAEGQGEHGWWRPPPERGPYRTKTQ